MTTSPNVVVMGLFRDRTLAEDAIRALQQMDWDIDNIRLLGGTSGGVFETLKHSMTGRDTSQESASDALAAFDLPEDQRQQYMHAVEQGSFIVVAYLTTHLLEARDVLNRYGAYQVALPLQLGGKQIIHLRQEVAQVQKYVVDVGEIRVHKRVITEEKTFTVPVTREEVTIERLPRQEVSSPSAGQSTVADVAVAKERPSVNAPASSVEETEVLRESGTIRIMVREEQVTIHKQPIIVEEIIIQKQVVQETTHLVEPLRHEEARVEQRGTVSVHEQLSDGANSFPPHEHA